MWAIAPGYELDVERGPGWLLVRVRGGNLNECDASGLGDHLWALMEQHFTHRLVLELEGVQTLNRDWIEQLVQLYQRIHEHDGVLRLCGLSPRNCRVLHACHLDDQLLPYCDREEAVMGCQRRPRPR